MAMKKVQNLADYQAKTADQLLMVAFQAVNPKAKADPAARCRFDVFVRLTPGIISHFKDQKRTWCYRGDKFTDEEHQMLRNLLNLIKRDIGKFDRIVLYDNSQGPDDREILRIIDGTIEKNNLRRYSVMLQNYILPDFLR